VTWYQAIRVLATVQAMGRYTSLRLDLFSPRDLGTIAMEKSLKNRNNKMRGWRNW
jgi:hypothetical protein